MIEILVPHAIRRREFGATVPDEARRVFAKLKGRPELAATLAAPDLPPRTTLHKVYATTASGARRLLFFCRPLPQSPRTELTGATRPSYIRPPSPRPSNPPRGVCRRHARLVRALNPFAPLVAIRRARSRWPQKAQGALGAAPVAKGVYRRRDNFDASARRRDPDRGALDRVASNADKNAAARALA